MPIYEYRCLDCGESWESREHMAEHEKVSADEEEAPDCPGCGGDRVEQVFSTFFAKTARKS